MNIIKPSSRISSSSPSPHIHCPCIQNNSVLVWKRTGTWEADTEFPGLFFSCCYCGCLVTVSTGRCLINPKGTEMSWWFPEGENVGLIRVFLSQDGVDNTKRVITRSRYASDPQQQQPCEWMAHFLSGLSQSEADKECLVLQSVFVLGDPWVHLWKTSGFSQATKPRAVHREGEVPSEFLACKLAGLFTFIFNIG